jgi:hypothetical protein
LHEKLLLSINSDITTPFCGQNVDASFPGLPPHGKMMFLICDLGYNFSNFIGDEIDKLCKKFLCNIFMLRSGVDPETLLTGGLSYGAIFSIIDGTNCSPKAVLACRSVNLVFISFGVQ